MRIAFFGTPAFAVPTLEALLRSAHEVVVVVTQPDRPRDRGQRVSGGPVKDVALAAGVRVLQPETLARERWEPELSACRIDLGVVAAYGKILPAWLLALPRIGFINVHASLLPRYRGASPVHRAVINGDTETGVTIMRVVQALDAGPMLAVARVPIGPDDRTDAVEHALALAGARLLVATIDRLATVPVAETPQNEAEASYAPRLRKDEGLIDWTRPARVVHNLVRGLHPWPHAYTFGPHGRLIVHCTALRPGERHDRPPGTILAADPSVGLLVAAVDEAIGISELQAEGGKVMPARAFLAGHPLKPGDRLTSTPA